MAKVEKKTELVEVVTTKEVPSFTLILTPEEYDMLAAVSDGVFYDCSRPNGKVWDSIRMNLIEYRTTPYRRSASKYHITGRMDIEVGD